MIGRNTRASRMSFRALLGAAALCAAHAAWAAGNYVPITPTMSDKTVVLNGRDLTIDQIVMVARHGAKVELSADARQREADNYGLLLEASAEGIPVYWFNRGAGDQRETVMFEGDPMSPKNHALVEKTQFERFHSGAEWGTGPEVANEEIVRAMMVVRANAMVYNAPSRAAVADAARPAQQADHPGGAVPRHAGRGRSGAARQRRRRHGGRRRGVLSGRAHAGRASAQRRRACLPIRPFARRRQCAHQQQCLRDRTGGAAGARCRAGARMGGPDLCHGSQRHEQQHHAVEPGRAARPARRSG